MPKPKVKYQYLVTKDNGVSYAIVEPKARRGFPSNGRMIIAIGIVKKQNRSSKSTSRILGQ